MIGRERLVTGLSGVWWPRVGAPTADLRVTASLSCPSKRLSCTGVQGCKINRIHRRHHPNTRKRSDNRPSNDLHARDRQYPLCFVKRRKESKIKLEAKTQTLRASRSSLCFVLHTGEVPHDATRRTQHRRPTEASSQENYGSGPEDEAAFHNTPSPANGGRAGSDG